MKRGQAGVFGLIFLDMFFIIVWALWLGGWLSTIGDQAIATTGVTGIEAFVFANLNLVVFIGFFLMNLVYFTFGGRE